MANIYSTPATKYNFNSVQDIHSHSASLFNERMSMLFYWLDLKAVSMNTNNNIHSIYEVRGLLKQIYKNIRSLISNNPTMRATLNLDTKDDGIYVPDIMVATIDSMIEYCKSFGFTTKKINILVYELNNLEVMLKNILQYYHYFLRPNFAQKPDVNIAVEKYKNFADAKTIEELRAIVGKNNHIDFESLGKEKIDFKKTDELEYEEINLKGRYKDVTDNEYYDEGQEE
jgi:hypothetical protein